MSIIEKKKKEDKKSKMKLNKDSSNLQSKTLVVQFFGGPGCRKSTMAASVFSKLKWLNYNCELVTEYAKDKVWEETEVILDNQIYVFAKQHHRIWRLLSKVDIIITDSPFVAGHVYDKEERKTLTSLMLSEYGKLNSLNFFINRSAIFNPSGRIHDEEQSIQLDKRIKDFLIAAQILYTDVIGEEKSVNKIIKMISKHLGEKREDS